MLLTSHLPPAGLCIHAPDTDVCMCYLLIALLSWLYLTVWLLFPNSLWKTCTIKVRPEPDQNVLLLLCLFGSKSWHKARLNCWIVHFTCRWEMHIKNAAIFEHQTETLRQGRGNHWYCFLDCTERWERTWLTTL